MKKCLFLLGVFFKEEKENYNIMHVLQSNVTIHPA